MAIVMPTDLGDINVWGPILDQALGVVVDRHDHTTGKGVKIPSAALNINADVSWSAGGVSRAITDLKAVDFAPSAVQTALAGALFVSDGTSGLTINELYWRTTSGVNVKLTAGSALNVAAFTGGIGGDYSAVGALVLFDDATDSYWFQQQVGASVRQYARMRSADVDLYEYKANPAAGVPTNRVRLASPTGLAASYALTMPPALPAVAGLLAVSSAGVMSTVPTLPASTSRAAVRVTAAGVFYTGEPTYYSASFAAYVTGPAIALSLTGGVVTVVGNSTVVLPLRFHSSDMLDSWSVSILKLSTSGTTITATLTSFDWSTGATSTIGSAQANSSAGTVLISLGQSSLGHVMSASKSYSISLAWTGAGAVQDDIRGYTTSS
jgi:hypothetical protein